MTMMNVRIRGVALCSLLALLPFAALSGCATRSQSQVELLGAVKLGDVETARSALAAGARADAADEYGISAISYAIVQNRVEMIRLLLDHGATLQPQHLITAAYAGHPDTVQIVLELGGSVEAIDAHGGTALHAATGSTSGEVVRLLAEAGVPVNARRGDGSTAPLLASENGYATTVAALLAAGADPNIPNDAGQTPLDWAIAAGHDDVVALLRDSGARTESAADGADIDAMERAADAASGRALLVQTTGVVTDGRNAKIRASVTNTYDETVEGVRYMVGLASTTGEILEWVQRESDARIAPGRRIIARLDVSSVYIGAKAGAFVVFAFPAKLGEIAVDPPSGWK